MPFQTFIPVVLTMKKRELVIVVVSVLMIVSASLFVLLFPWVSIISESRGAHKDEATTTATPPVGERKAMPCSIGFA